MSMVFNNNLYMKKIILILTIVVFATVTIFYFSFYKKNNRPKVAHNGSWGIDISHHQKNVDFDKLVKENKPAFVFLKSTEGKSHKDVAYTDRLNKFRELGIPVGGYHFFN